MAVGKKTPFFFFFFFFFAKFGYDSGALLCLSGKAIYWYDDGYQKMPIFYPIGPP